MLYKPGKMVMVQQRRGNEYTNIGHVMGEGVVFVAHGLGGEELSIWNDLDEAVNGVIEAYENRQKISYQIVQEWE